MSDNVIQFPTRKAACDPAKDQGFDLCPECGRTDGFLNVGREHWFVCHAHRTCWHIGSNLFSGWREQNEVEWQRNAALLATYRTVAPVWKSPMVADKPIARPEIHDDDLPF